MNDYKQQNIDLSFLSSFFTNYKENNKQSVIEQEYTNAQQKLFFKALKLSTFLVLPLTLVVTAFGGVLVGAVALGASTVLTKHLVRNEITDQKNAYNKVQNAFTNEQYEVCIKNYLNKIKNNVIVSLDKDSQCKIDIALLHCIETHIIQNTSKNNILKNNLIIDINNKKLALIEFYNILQDNNKNASLYYGLLDKNYQFNENEALMSPPILLDKNTLDFLKNLSIDDTVLNSFGLASVGAIEERKKIQELNEVKQQSLQNIYSLVDTIEQKYMSLLSAQLKQEFMYIKNERLKEVEDIYDKTKNIDLSDNSKQSLVNTVQQLEQELQSIVQEATQSVEKDIRVIQHTNKMRMSK